MPGPAREAGSVPHPAQFSLRLAKEDFAFAAAHFTLFAHGEAERLHGHNYRVRVRLTAATLDEAGMIAPVAPVKASIRSLCAALDERVLLPEKSPQLVVVEEGDAIGVTYGARTYRFPRDEVLRLPLPNVTIESLAWYLWDALAATLPKGNVDSLCVEVEETAGQSAAYEAPL